MKRIRLTVVSTLFIFQAIILSSTPAYATDHIDKVRIWLGGDVHLGDISANPLKNMVALTDGGIGIVNLEGPIHKVGGAEFINGKWVLFNHNQSAAFLKEGGVRIVSVANNHQKDAGAAGIELTEDALKGGGLLPVGGSEKAVRIIVGGLNVSVVQFDLTDGLPSDVNNIINTTRKVADILIAIFHTTSPPSYLPDTLQRTVAEISIVAGADVVAFHGSHMLGPVERRGEKVIAWGLGNIVFNCRCTDEKEAMLLDITVHLKEGRKIIESCIIPIEAGLNGAFPVISKKGDDIFDLLYAIGSPALTRIRNKGCF